MSQRAGHKKGITSRACSKCGGDLGDLYKKQRYCKSCKAAAMREHRKKYGKPAAIHKENERLKGEVQKLKKELSTKK